MAVPYIPETITVHLGLPSSSAENVTVPFPEYVANVASSEIYPTWEISALRANILAIVSYALNRVYTEYYRSRGYSFQITASTAYDQKFIKGRNVFENIEALSYELFDDYLRRAGHVEPLSASFCNGTTSQCAGMSQWGSQSMAQAGSDSVEILRHYYGGDVEIVTDAPVQAVRASYPGAPLRLGDAGNAVRTFQTALNRIAKNYPLIPVLDPADGVFGAETDAAVRVFQKIFNLTVDGIVGKATWYKAVQLYAAILRLNELDSEGQKYAGISWEYPDAIQKGDSGVKVSHLQYMLSVLAQFLEEIPPLRMSGYFDEETKAAVADFQRFAGLPATGTVGAETWDAIYNRFAGAENQVLAPERAYPPIGDAPDAALRAGMRD